VLLSVSWSRCTKSSLLQRRWNNKEFYFEYVKYFFCRFLGGPVFPSISTSYYTEALLFHVDSHPIKFRGCLCFCEYQNTTWLCNTVVIRHTICSVITYCSFKGYLCSKPFMFVLLQGLLWHCAWGSYFYWCVMSYVHQKLTTLVVDARMKNKIKIMSVAYSVTLLYFFTYWVRHWPTVKHGIVNGKRKDKFNPYPTNVENRVSS